MVSTEVKRLMDRAGKKGGLARFFELLFNPWNLVGVVMGGFLLVFGYMTVTGKTQWTGRSTGFLGLFLCCFEC